MPTFTHDRVEIAYLDEGEGDPILLIHGFASNRSANWVEPGWVKLLVTARARNSMTRRPIRRPPWRRTPARCSTTLESRAPT
jgi:pimeloyl-ACP methyl ester carboxylesterase